MAASDPVPGVPTPTGTLQGAAAFSWDGANWQPAAAAYSSVATPTGVLRGVAPFSWSGSAWTPAGKAMPGVPTPTGTLDGVALYTWSGSAWTPSGGAPDVPTPSGTLQGIAAFYWDGTNWQPTGQAGAEVTTPSGVLQGVAMFNWSGSAWVAASSGPPGVTLDLNFLTMGGTLDPRVTFTRASTATYFDSTGTMQSAATNVPRFDYNPSTLQLNGLLIEEARTNLLLNSATLSTQSVTTAATATTLSFYGTGSITRSGTASGTTNGTGATTRVSVTFTPTAGTLTLTVTGSVTNAQVEAGAFATSYIPTAGATATRAVDVATIATIPGRNTAAESWNAEFLTSMAAPPANARVISTTANQAAMIGIKPGSLNGFSYDNASSLSTANAYIAGAVAKMASTWASPNAGTVCLNGGPVASTTTQTGGFSTVVVVKLGGDTLATDQFTGYIRRFRYWPRILSNAELQSVTT